VPGVPHACSGPDDRQFVAFGVGDPPTILRLVEEPATGCDGRGEARGREIGRHGELEVDAVALPASLRLRRIELLEHQYRNRRGSWRSLTPARRSWTYPSAATQNERTAATSAASRKSWVKRANPGSAVAPSSRAAVWTSPARSVKSSSRPWASSSHWSFPLSRITRPGRRSISSGKPVSSASAAAVWLVMRANRRESDGAHTQAARRVLDERLARGEIALDEYRERRDAMR
jgi:hypothetical protein